MEDMAPTKITRAAENGSQPGLLTRQEIHDLLGALMDSKIAAILRVGATRNDLDAAIAWLAGETETLSEGGHPLSGKAAEIFDIPTSEDLWVEDASDDGA
jgi:hypothetical protein